MKKILFLIIFSLGINYQLSAQIPNGGFESWVSDTLPSGGWFTSNSWLDSSVLKTSDSYAGNYATQLITPDSVYLIPGPFSEGDWVYVMLQSAYIVTSAKSLSFRVKCDDHSGYGWSRIVVDLQGNDPWSYDPQWSSETAVPEYTLVELPLDQNGDYDSLRIMMFASVPLYDSGKAMGHVSLKVDDLKFIGADETFKFYPNPALDQITISNTEIPIEEIALTDLQGRSVLNAKKINKKFFQLDLSFLQSGQYFLEMKANDRVILEKIEKL